MIPKKIHYCWFGRSPLPKDALKCIASWKKFFPDYEIIEWNEDNFDVNQVPYTQQAYEAKKYAFVSDFARFKILYEHGGIYFDTDVEVIKSFDSIVEQGPFMGKEMGKCHDKRYKEVGWMDVNPGLGMGAFPGMDFYKKMIDYYSSCNYIQDGVVCPFTVCQHTTNNFIEHGLTDTPEIIKIEDIFIYPPEYFNPLDDATGRLRITDNTHSIHWYSKSWINESKFRRNLSRLSHRILGREFIPKIKRKLKIK